MLKPGNAHCYIQHTRLVHTRLVGKLWRTQLPTACLAVKEPITTKVSTAEVDCLAREQHSSVNTSTDSSQHDSDQNATAHSVAPLQTYSGYIELMLVAFFWGAYNPAVRAIYMEENPLDPATLTMIRTVLSAAALAVAVAISNPSDGADKSSKSEIHQGTSLAKASTKASTDDSKPFLGRTFDSVVLGGIELGMYNFLGTSLQATGLQLTSATRAGFLLTMTGILVPVLSWVAGNQISGKVWAAVALGLAGSCLVAYDAVHGSESSSVDLHGLAEASGGEWYLLLSCVFYSLATVRLSIYSPRFKSVELAAVKKFTLGVASLIWWLSQSERGWLDGAPQGLLGPDSAALMHRSLASWSLIFFSALGPGALATFLQTRGQATVPATQAQVIFSLTPLWSAAIAQLTLGGEAMGPLSWAGGAVVLLASVLSTQAQQHEWQQSTAAKL